MRSHFHNRRDASVRWKCSSASLSCFAHQQQESVADCSFCYMGFLWWYSNNRCCRNFMADCYWWSRAQGISLLVLWLLFSLRFFFCLFLINMPFSLFPRVKFLIALGHVSCLQFSPDSQWKPCVVVVKPSLTHFNFEAALLSFYSIQSKWVDSEKKLVL